VYLDTVKQQLQQLGLVQPDELVGCTASEISKLQQELGISLPKAYQEFLLEMGHGAGQFLRGTDCFFKHLPYLREWAIDLLEENKFPQPLPNDAFVFFMHQGYQFSFFLVSEGDDPPIYSYCEGENQIQFTKTKEKFSDFMKQEVEIHKKYLLTFSSH